MRFVARAVAGVVVAAALGVVGGGSASADICRTNNTFGDVDLDVWGVGEVSVEQENIGDPNGQGVWVCLVPPSQGAGVGLRDANPANLVGLSFEASTCGTLGCTGVGLTGVEVGTPGTTLVTTGPTTDVGAHTGPATCAYATGIPVCPGSTPLAGVSIANGDLPTTSGSNVIVGGDTSRNTVTVDSAVVTVPANVARQCVGPSMPC